ncbi:MAG TPA: YciI family protein [Gemmatimonadaceae bacterium]|nr:YciI family protein [Gemmatimonadaceae bacterium]
MKYMMMMNTPAGTGDYQINNWSPDDFKAHIAFMHDFNRQLTEAGEMVACEGLTPPAQARLVRAGKDGRPVTDGPFPETKEFLAGFWIIDVDSATRAYTLAAVVSAAPGPGGAALNMAIELRPVMSAPPDPSAPALTR